MKESLLSAEEAAAQAAALAQADICIHSDAHRIAAHLQDGMAILKVPGFADAAAASVAALGEKRVFLPAYCAGSLSYAASLRLPLVCVVFSPHVSECITFMASDVQELADTIMQSYAIAENSKILAPVVVAFDGYASTREIVQLPAMQSARGYIGRIKIPNKIDMKRPSLLAAGDDTQNANVLPVAEKADEAWKKKFHRGYGLLDAVAVEDANTVLVSYGFHAPTVKAAAKTLREKGEPVGFLRLRLLNPLPQLPMLKNKGIIAFDTATLLGRGFAARMLGGQSVIVRRHLSENDVLAAVKSGGDVILK